MHEDVLRLDVSVDDTPVVEVGEGSDYLMDELEGLVDAQPSFLRQQVPLRARRVLKSPSAQYSVTM